jgi:hypothetical protein
MGERLFSQYVVIDEKEAQSKRLSEIVRGIVINEMLLDYAPNSVGAGSAERALQVLYAELDRREEEYKSVINNHE